MNKIPALAGMTFVFLVNMYLGKIHSLFLPNFVKMNNNLTTFQIKSFYFCFRNFENQMTKK